MGRRDSSRGRRTRRAGGGDRCTTSSITGQGSVGSRQEAVGSEGEARGAESQAATGADSGLSAEQCEELVGLLLKGASVRVACKEMGVPVWSALRAIESEAELAQRVREVNGLRSQDVAAALYQAAMKGSVTAQTFWLRSSPPAEWQGDAEPPIGDEMCDGLTDEELEQLERSLATDLPDQGQAGADAAGDEGEAGGVS